MSISGHKDKRTFYSYILLSGEEVAEEITAKLKELEQKKKRRRYHLMKISSKHLSHRIGRWLSLFSKTINLLSSKKISSIIIKIQTVLPYRIYSLYWLRRSLNMLHYVFCPQFVCGNPPQWLSTLKSHFEQKDCSLIFVLQRF